VLDILIHGAQLIDGTGATARRADVGVRGDRIAAVGELADAEAGQRIDASGLVVCPGFVDIHNHAHAEAEGGITTMPQADNMVRQGVTTLVAGNCGGSRWPIDEHLAAVEQLEIRQNYATFIGHSTVRGKALRGKRAADPEALEQICRLIVEGVEQGAMGVSTGLPNSSASTNELIEVARAAARAGGIYASHIRDEGEKLLEAVDEAIQVARQAEAPVQISHLKTYGSSTWPKIDTLEQMLYKAADEGLPVTADRYPYTRCFTGIRALARDAASRLLGKKDRTAAETGELLAAIRRRIDFTGGPEHTTLAPLTPALEVDGKTLADYSRDQGLSPAEAVLQLTERGGVSAIYDVMCEANLHRILALPMVMVSSDGHLRIHGRGVSHPRNYGTFPRVLGKYVREEGVVPLGEAVKKMTSMPAEKLKLRDRGVVRQGAFADLVILDPRTVTDRATFEDSHRYPVGIEYVIVNGGVAVAAGETAAGCFGRVLRRH